MMARIIPFLERFATVGMTVVLGVLTTVAIGGGVFTQQADARVADSVAQNRVLQQASLLMSKEALLQREYYLHPTPVTRKQFDALNTQIRVQIEAVVRVLMPNPSVTDSAAVTNALGLQTRFVSAAHSFFTATDLGNQIGARTIDDQRIEPLVTTMQQLVRSAAAVTDRQLASNIRSLNTTARDVRLGALATFIPGLLLVLVFGRLFRGYRRQVASVVRMEMNILEQAALTDYLTGLGNHRAYAEEEARAFARARRDGVGLALALIDVDRFKQINDQNDHSYGDRILAGLGEELRGGRAADRAFRIGGDEFAVILPASPNVHPTLALERLREAVANRLLGVTLSVGIASLEPDVDTMAVLRERADAALYEAKRRGRNTVVSFGWAGQAQTS